MADAQDHIPFDFQSIELDLDGLIVEGLRGVSFEHGFERSKIFGATREALDETIGVYDVQDFELTMLESAHTTIIAKLGKGYMTKRFDLSVTYNFPDKPTKTVELQNCRIKSESHDYQQGPDGLEVSITCSAMKALINKLDPAKS